MDSDIVQTAREHYTLRRILSTTIFVLILYGITGSEGVLVGLVLAVVVGGGIDTLRKTPSIDSRWIGLGGGVIFTLSSLAWLGYEYTTTPETGGAIWLPLLAVIGGVWMILDSRRNFVEGRQYDSGPHDDMGMSKIMLVMNHANLIAEELKTGPKTVEELAEACDLTESRVREALDFITDDGTVYRVDDEMTDDSERYALNESMVGSVAFIRTGGKRVVQRLTRPFHR